MGSLLAAQKAPQELSDVPGREGLWTKHSRKWDEKGGKRQSSWIQLGLGKEGLEEVGRGAASPPAQGDGVRPWSFVGWGFDELAVCWVHSGRLWGPEAGARQCGVGGTGSLGLGAMWVGSVHRMNGCHLSGWEQELLSPGLRVGIQEVAVSF